MKTKLFFVVFAFIVFLTTTLANAQSRIKARQDKSVTSSRDYTGSLNAVSTLFPADASSSKAACDTLNLFAYQNTWTIVDYSITATPQYSLGFVNGVNTYADKAKANYFANSNANTYVLGGMIAFSKAYASNPAKIITVKLWNVLSGSPNNVLAQKTLTMAEVMSDVNGNYFTNVNFPTPVNVGGAPFFLGVDFSGLNWSTFHDTLSIQSNQSPQTSPSAVWELQSDNLWYQYTTPNSFNLSISLAVFPIMSNVPADASFTQSATNTCTGYPVTLNAAASIQNTVYWVLAGATPSSSNVVAPVVTYANPGTYPIKLYVHGGSCNNLDSMITSINIIAAPNPSATATPSAICLGNSSVLSAANGISYQWNGYPLGPSPNQTVTPTQTTVYTVTVTGSNGCSASQNATVTINPPPQPNATANPANLCGGNTTLISTQAGMSAYLWMPGGNTNAAFTASPASTTTYTVTVTDAMGCSATDNVTVTVDPQMVTVMSATNAICGNSNGTATVAVAYGGISPFYYAWSTSPVQTSPQATGLAQGTYYVTVTDSYGCTMKDTAVVNCVVGLTDHYSAAGISIVPNPSSGQFWLEITGCKDQQIAITVFNFCGQMVCNENISILSEKYTHKIDLTSFAKGIYFLSLKSESIRRTVKLVVE